MMCESGAGSMMMSGSGSMTGSQMGSSQMGSSQMGSSQMGSSQMSRSAGMEVGFIKEKKIFPHHSMGHLVIWMLLGPLDPIERWQ